MSIQSAHRSNDENTRPHSGAASSREADLGSAPIGSLLFKLALPAIAAQIINVLYNMVDRMYIGHIPDIGSQRPDRCRRHNADYHRAFPLLPRSPPWAVLPQAVDPDGTRRP